MSSELRAAAEQPQPEPVAWYVFRDGEMTGIRTRSRKIADGWIAEGQDVRAVYLAPPPPAAAPTDALLTHDEMADLRRFDATTQDGEGYDVAAPRMRRLAEIGAVRRVGGGRYTVTDFGRAALAAREGR